MDPVSLSLGVVAAALVSKAAERAGEHASDAGASGLRQFTDWLRGRVAGREVETVALDRVEDAPDSASRVQVLSAALDQRAEEDRTFRDELSGAIEQARQDGVEVKSIAQTAIGNQNVQVADVQGAVSVTYGDRPPSPGR